MNKNGCRLLVLIMFAIKISSVLNSFPIITPNVQDITVKSGSDVSLNCTAEYPIKWLGMKYNEINKWVDNTTGNYGSSITLQNVSFKSVGFLYCVSDSLGNYSVKGTFIYLYVDDPVHVMVPISKLEISVLKDDIVIIPCKPTSKKYIAAVDSYEIDTFSFLRYDPRYGSFFKMHDTSFFYKHKTWLCVVGNYTELLDSAMFGCK